MFLVSMRSLWLAIATLIHLVRSVVNWHTDIIWRFILWTVNITTLPVRALGALRREKTMERLLQEMQGELQNRIWDNKRLEAHLQMSVKEYHLMESMLGELEDDLDKVIVKIELLETEVQDLKEENFRLREVHYKHLRDPTSKISSTQHQITGTTKTKSTPLPEDLTVHETSGADDRPTGVCGHNPNPAGLVDPLTPMGFLSDIGRALDQRRGVALSQSLFSALLSLLVGVIIWEAGEPCMPLVMALFFVVGLSLRSVIEFFSTIRNRPASHAVALLSFNSFILGTLTYPTLPRVAGMLSR